VTLCGLLACFTPFRSSNLIDFQLNKTVYSTITKHISNSSTCKNQNHDHANDTRQQSTIMYHISIS